MNIPPKCASALVILLLLLSACQSGQKPRPLASPPPAPTVARSTATPSLPAATGTSAPSLAPADASSPASGICPEAPAGGIVTITVNLDVPSPRCVKGGSTQRLRILNRTNGDVQVHLGSFDVTARAGEAQTLDAAFGTYLAPGVHRVVITPPGYAAELWVVNTP